MATLRNVHSVHFLPGLINFRLYSGNIWQGIKFGDFCLNAVLLNLAMQSHNRKIGFTGFKMGSFF